MYKSAGALSLILVWHGICSHQSDQEKTSGTPVLPNRDNYIRANILAGVLEVTLSIGYRLPLVILFILTCSILDYLFTVTHLSRGLQELNPVMDYLFNLGFRTAFIFKYYMTAAGLMILCILNRNFRVRGLLIGIAVAYTALTCYHVYLLRAA